MMWKWPEANLTFSLIYFQSLNKAIIYYDSRGANPSVLVGGGKGTVVVIVVWV